jgi:hypothetical protein
MPVTDMPMRAAFLLQEQSAELGWNHEYNTRPLTGTGVFCVPAVMLGIGRRIR